MYDDGTFYHEFSHIEGRQNTTSTFFGDDFSQQSWYQPLNNPFMAREDCSSDDDQDSFRTIRASSSSVNGCDEYRSPTPPNLILPNIIDDVPRPSIRPAPIGTRIKRQPTPSLASPVAYPSSNLQRALRALRTKRQIPGVLPPIRPPTGTRIPRQQTPACPTSNRPAYRRNPKPSRPMKRQMPEAGFGHYNILPSINVEYSHHSSERKTERTSERRITAKGFYHKSNTRHYEHTKSVTYNSRKF